MKDIKNRWREDEEEDNPKSRVVRRTFWLMKVVPTWKKFEKRWSKFYTIECSSRPIKVIDSKIYRENSSFITFWQEWRVLYMQTDICTVMIISRSVIFRMRNVPDKRWRENQNAILSSITRFRKSCRLWENVETYCRSGQATGGNMAHARSTLDN